MKAAKSQFPLLAAALLTATGLGIGFFADDAYHLMVLEGEKSPAVDGNLYTFATGDPMITLPFIETGPYPWWTLPEMKAVFFRPLSNALHRFDHALFGRRAVYWHLHAMCWYLAMVFLWTRIARQTLTPPVASLSAIIFAIDECHWMPAVWLANRNALVACVPALFGLYAHIRWREDHWKAGFPLSLLGYAVGMFGGEAWLGMAAYVAGYELFGRRDSIAQRAACLAPAAICALVYALLYQLNGYGVFGSDAYTQPFSRQYFHEAPARAFALLGGLLVGSPVDIWVFFPQVRLGLAATGIFGVFLIAVLLGWAWPSLGERDRIAVKWLVPAGILSLVPVIAAFPMSRLLLGPSLASSAVIAMVLRHWWTTRIKGHVRPAGVVCVLLTAQNLVFAPLAWPVQSLAVMVLERMAKRICIDAPLDDTRVAQQDVFLISSFDPVSIMYLPIMRRLEGRPMPGSWHGLSASPSSHIFTRVANNAFELEPEPEHGVLVQGLLADVLRGSQFPFAAGDAVKIRNGRISVLEVVEGRPRKIRVDCDKSLDDPSLVLLQFTDFSVRKFEPPAVGEARVLRYAGP